MSTRRLAVGSGLVLLYLLAVGSLAVRAQLWNDELYTWYIARLPTWGDVWDTLETGVEQLPPFYYAIVRAALFLFGDNQLALRVPSLLGFLAGCFCLFLVVSRRAGAWYGLIAALVPLATGAAPYAWEARPYALVFAFAAAAVLCHQLRADDVRPTLAAVGLGAALAGATAVHYYGALVGVPIALGEAVRWRGRRKLDRAVVVALFAPLVPLAFSIPLIEGARKYSGQFWTDFDLGSAGDFVLVLLRADVFSESRIPTWLGLGFAAVVLGAALLILLRPPRSAQLEIAIAIGFVLLPVVGILVGEIATGAYTERYVLSAVIGPALLIPLALHRAAPGRTVVAAGAAAVLALWFGVLFQYWQREIGVDTDRRARLVAFLEDHVPADDTVAVVHPHDYLELVRYAPADLRDRLVRLSDPQRALRYTGSRSTEDGLVVLSGFTPVRIVEYDRERSPFLLLRTVRGSARDWIVPALENDGARMHVVARDEGDGFTLVRVTPAAST
jgi:4-amino-4-deoxy-L-arabinose transferase-like glycosyltransferase